MGKDLPTISNTLSHLKGKLDWGWGNLLPRWLTHMANDIGSHFLATEASP